MARIKPQTLLLQSNRKKSPARVGVTTIVACNLILVLLVFFMVATYRHLSSRRSGADVEKNGFEDSESLRELKKYDLPSYAALNTSKGLITVELLKETSPEVVDKFLDLCHKEHFKGMLFHHVVKNFVIQGGDPQAPVEDWTLGKIQSRRALSPKHEAFMLGTSQVKPDNNFFGLFITTAPIPDLNEKITVFGRVIKGEDIVQEIEEVDTDEHFRPKSPIGIINITLKREP